MWNCLVKLGFLVERSAANGFYTHHIMLHEIRLVWISASWRRDQMNLVFDVPSWELLLQTVSTSTHFYASVHFMCTRLHNIPAACVLCIHTKGKGHVLTSCPWNMSHVSANFDILGLYLQSLLSTRTPYEEFHRLFKSVPMDQFPINGNVFKVLSIQVF